MAKQLRVNPIDCTGHGLCAQILPELIALDEWGYPILPTHPVPPDLERQARRAVTGCPTLALALTERPRPAPARGANRAESNRRGKAY